MRELPSLRPTRVVASWSVVIAFVFLSGKAPAEESMAIPLVAEGSEGLLYRPYSNEGQSNAINTVPDFSVAGYRGGGDPIPFVPTVATLNAPTGGDDTALIQKAIDSVAAMDVQGNGFRGAVLIKAGDYRVANTLEITVGGLVIRGEGNEATGGTRITMTATEQDNLFEVKGSGSPFKMDDTTQRIADDYVPVGARSFTLADASGYEVGNRIQVKNTVNDQWIVYLGMHNLSDADPADADWTAAGYQLHHEREIIAINGYQITLNSPEVQTIENQYGGGEIFQYTFRRQIENIGLQSLYLESTFLSETDEEHGWIGIKFNDVRNAWVRQVTGRYLGRGLVSVEDTCHYVTNDDCAMIDPKSETIGGRKYSFNIDKSTFVLVQRCYTRGARHDFVSASRTPGPNVFVDCLAEEAGYRITESVETIEKQFTGNWPP